MQPAGRSAAPSSSWARQRGSHPDRAQARLRQDLSANPELYYKSCNGFTAMVEHPKLSAETIQALQRRCFREDFRRLGPSIYRSVATWLKGHRTLARSTSPLLRRKSERFARDLRKAYPVFLAGRLFGPGRAARKRIGELQREVHAAIGRPSASERLQSLAAAGMALWTALTLRLGLFQHPRLAKHAWRLPAEARQPARIWKKLVDAKNAVSVERRPDGAVGLRLDGALGAEDVVCIARHTPAPASLAASASTDGEDGAQESASRTERPALDEEAWRQSFANASVEELLAASAALRAEVEEESGPITAPGDNYAPLAAGGSGTAGPVQFDPGFKSQ